MESLNNVEGGNNGVGRCDVEVSAYLLRSSG